MEALTLLPYCYYIHTCEYPCRCPHKPISNHKKGMNMQFCTAISCMDGRVHLAVISYLKKRFQAEYVDLITEPGPDLIMAEQTDSHLVESIFARIHVSVSKHKSGGIAVIGHHDCAGNPVTKDEHIQQVKKSIELIRQQYKEPEIIGVWVDENWQASEIPSQLRCSSVQ